MERISVNDFTLGSLEHALSFFLYGFKLEKPHWFRLKKDFRKRGVTRLDQIFGVETFIAVPSSTLTSQKNERSEKEIRFVEPSQSLPQLSFHSVSFLLSIASLYISKYCITRFSKSNSLG